MKRSSFSLQSRLNSFGFAFNGLLAFFRQEPNARIHLVATGLVIASSVYFKLSGFELVALVIVTGFVWTAEIINTAIERSMDFISTESNPRIQFIKDVSASAVLIAAITALLTGCIIFIPKIF